MDNEAIERAQRATCKARDDMWAGVGTVDPYVLAHAVNPGIQGMPRWPDLRQSYRIIRLPNGRTIIATDGLSDPFMAGHPLYDPAKNGFGLELYVEVSEEVDAARAGTAWWQHLLYQMSLEVAYDGQLLGSLQENNGLYSQELNGVPGLPESNVYEERATVLLGIPSAVVPARIAGPLSPIHFVSVTLLTVAELQYILEKMEAGRKLIAQRFIEKFGGPLSVTGRESVVAETAPQETDYIDPTAQFQEKLFFNLHIFAIGPERQELNLAFLDDNDQEQTLADRVMPGQTLNEAITHMVKSELGIPHWRPSAVNRFSDIAHDKQGNEVVRVDVSIEVPYFVTNEDERILGMRMQWFGLES